LTLSVFGSTTCIDVTKIQRKVTNGTNFYSTLTTADSIAHLQSSLRVVHRLFELSGLRWREKSQSEKECDP
jgi:hypothetical protein